MGSPFNQWLRGGRSVRLCRHRRTIASDYREMLYPRVSQCTAHFTQKVAMFKRRFSIATLGVVIGSYH